MTAPLIPIAWCLYCPHGEVADDPQTAHTALEHHYTHHHPVEHLSEPPKPFGQPAWLRAGAVIMYAEPGIAELGIHYGDKCLSVPLSLRELEDLATAIDDALAVAQRKAES